MDSHWASSPGNIERCVKRSSLLPFTWSGPDPSDSESEPPDSDPKDSDLRCFFQTGLDDDELDDDELEDSPGASNRFMLGSCFEQV